MANKKERHERYKILHSGMAHRPGALSVTGTLVRLETAVVDPTNNAAI